MLNGLFIEKAAGKEAKLVERRTFIFLSENLFLDFISISRFLSLAPLLVETSLNQGHLTYPGFGAHHFT